MPAFFVATVVVNVITLEIIVYAIYRYLTWIGPGQVHVVIAFIGGLLGKLLILGIPVFARWALKKFNEWLGTDTVPPPKP
jgi:hypothetical protein